MMIINDKVTTILDYDKIKLKLRSKCRTAIGGEIVDSLNMSGDIEEVLLRLNETNESVRINELSTPPLTDTKDIREFLKRAKIGKALEIVEIIDIRSTMSAMRDVKKFFKEIEIDSKILKSRSSQIEILGNLEQKIDRTIDEHGAIRDDASAELLKIRRGLKSAQESIKEKIFSILHNPTYQKYFQETIYTMRGDRYVIPIKQEYRREFPGLVHDQSATAATVFIEPMAIVEVGNRVRELTAAERNEIARILRVLTNEINSHSEILLNNLQILGQIDFAFAKAELAREMIAVEPLINKDGRTKLFKARHPLIDAEKVVPIDLEIGQRYKMLLITGPNTGGKTVSLKTLGLLSMMAQSGLYIPAEIGSELTIYKNIFAMIGDEQSIEQSLSTFSGHMTQLVSIMNNVDADDLVLLDEIGAGTDPEEGSALAQAILEKLLQINATTLATTHYTQLKTFAYSTEDVMNASVEFDVETLKPTYKLLIGQPGTSRAFAISERLGLSKELIKRAKEFLTQESVNFEQVLSGLERERLEYEQRNDDLVKRQRELAKVEKRVNELRDELNKNKAEILRKAREKSAAMIRKTKREAEEIIESLKEQFDDLGIKRRQQAIQEARARLNESEANFAPGIINQRIGKRIDGSKLEVGDVVYITKLDQKGTITAISNNGDDLTVQVGALTANIKSSICRFVSKNSSDDELNSLPITSNKNSSSDLLQIASTIQREIDVRGMLVNEAESLIGKFIDGAAIGGLKTVLIIHGKGTGALRTGIHKYLKSNKSVKSFALADIDEGGAGATVVTIA